MGVKPVPVLTVENYIVVEACTELAEKDTPIVLPLPNPAVVGTGDSQSGNIYASNFTCAEFAEYNNSGIAAAAAL